MRTRTWMIGWCGLAVGMTLGACKSDVKDQFLADIDGQDATGDAVGDALDGTSTADVPADTGDSHAPDGTVPTDGTTPDTIAHDTTADTGPADGTDATSPEDVAQDTSQPSDVVDIPPTTDTAFGWAVPFAGAAPATPIAIDGGLAVALARGPLVELHAWALDGSPLWTSSITTGIAPVVTGAVICDGEIVVTGGEPDGSKAFAAQIDETDPHTVKLVTFTPAAGTTGGRADLGAPLCGGLGVVFTLIPDGAITYHATGGGTVQLTADQDADKQYLVDATTAFGATGALSTVSAADIGIALAAAGPGERVFYVGDVLAPKTLGSTTLAVGDELVYAHDFQADSGGTVTGAVFRGDDDITALAPATAAGDARFAIAWRAHVTEAPAHVETRISTYDGQGTAGPVAVLPDTTTVDQLVWDGESLVVAGTFDGAVPYVSTSLTSGSYLIVLSVGATSLDYARGAAFSGSASVGPLARVTTGGACVGDGWASVARGAADLRVIAVADNGQTCRSALFGVTGGDALAAIVSHAWSDVGIAGRDGVHLSSDGLGSWPDGASGFAGLIRARATTSPP